MQTETQNPENPENPENPSPSPELLLSDLLATKAEEMTSERIEQIVQFFRKDRKNYLEKEQAAKKPKAPKEPKEPKSTKEPKETKEPKTPKPKKLKNPAEIDALLSELMKGI